MRVLVLSNLYPPDVVGGYELACSHVVDALRGRGHDVRVLTAAPRRPVEDEPHVSRRMRLLDEWCHHGMGVTDPSLRIDEVESRFISAHNVNALASAVAAFRPDVVYACSLVGVGGLGLIAALQHLGVPWVWQLGDRDPYHLCGTRDGILPGLAAQFSARVRGHYIAVSQRLVEELASYRIRLEGHLEVIPNWIRGERPSPRRSFYRGGTLRIVSAGQVSRQKGIDVLIEAAARLREAGIDDFVIDVFGTLHDPSLPALVRGLGVDGHVTLRGPRPHADLQRIYGDYDVLAFPTHEREPFGLVPLEAAARGCVPVLTRSCGVAEWLVHGAHCFKAERTPEAFAAALRRIIAGEVDLGSIARRVERLAWDDFHLDAIIPRIEAVLRRAADQPRAPGRPVSELYRLARLAEQIARTLAAEAVDPPSARAS